MRVGSLFTGYGGLDMAVGGTLAWYSEIEPAACRVLAAHHPDTPNLGDVTTVNWRTVPRVDVLTAGYPCQPFSHAGKRKGTDDPRHLWPHVATAISVLEPGAAVLENVSGHLRLGMDFVLGDLADLGYDARWGVVRASEAGAPHSRARVFIVATPNPHRRRLRGQQVPHRVAGLAGQDAKRTRQRQRSRPITDSSTTADSGRIGREGPVWDMSGLGRRPSPRPDVFGLYADAVARWEHILGRPAPTPVDPSASYSQRLQPDFVEWMMGLPQGWVTGHGLSNAQSLKMLGNGVVPQQARLALDLLAVA